MTDAALDRPAVIRAMRAYLGQDQVQVAEGAGVSRRTLLAAEAGTMTDKTWGRLTAYYADLGLEWWGEPAGIRVRIGIG